MTKEKNKMDVTCLKTVYCSTFSLTNPSFTRFTSRFHRLFPFACHSLLVSEPFIPLHLANNKIVWKRKTENNLVTVFGSALS